MILLSFFSSIEFYVIMAVIAAAIVAFAGRPQTRGEMIEYLLAGNISNRLSEENPSVTFRCSDSGRVTLIRKGVEGVTISGAVSISVQFDGLNLFISERLVQGNKYDMPINVSEFELDFLHFGRYHVKYDSEVTGLFVAFQLHVRPGMEVYRPLSR